MKYYVYILESTKNRKLYIGQTNNLKDRLERHNQKRMLATKSGTPWKLIYKEKYISRSTAMKREKYLKSLKNKKYIKEKIICCGVEE